MDDNLKTLLLVGMDLVGLASSAKKAGYKVFAADFFGDLDLKKICDRCESIIDQKTGESTGKLESYFNPDDFLKISQDLNNEAEIDGVLLSSGLDDSFEILKKLDKLPRIIGNSPETIQRVRNKSFFFEELGRLGLSYPYTKIVESFDEAEIAAKDIGYPLVLKPLDGFGGYGIRKIEEQGQLEKIYKKVKSISTKLVVQKYIEGINASISFIAGSNKVKMLTLNEQLLGLKKVGQNEPFQYCGNIVPLDASESTLSQCKQIVNKIGDSFQLRGSNGVDIVISKEGIPNVIEVNPRFQGTLECVEKNLDLNLVEMHMKACIEGDIPHNKWNPKGYSTRLITYAPKRLYAPDLKAFNWVRDVPLPSSIVEKGEPLCSIFSYSESRSISWKRALERAHIVYELAKYPSLAH
jgi:predicted ATP-grasp superfamily ATP-dependent carboligase